MSGSPRDLLLCWVIEHAPRNPEKAPILQVGDVIKLKLTWAPIPKGWRKDRPPPPELIGYAPDGFQVFFPREKIMKFKEGDVIRAVIQNLHPPEDPVLYLADVEADTNPDGASEIEAMAMNHPFIHVESADVKETFIYAGHPVAIVDVWVFGGIWNPMNKLIMFDTKTWGKLIEEEKRVLLDHEIVEREFAMEDYAQYRTHSDAVKANHAKANEIISERYGAEVIDDLIARGLLAE